VSSFSFFAASMWHDDPSDFPSLTYDREWACTLSAPCLLEKEDGSYVIGRLIQDAGLPLRWYAPSEGYFTPARWALVQP
jgi:hypothetical protein